MESKAINKVALSLDATDALRKPVIQAAIQSLNLAPESKGLDTGCGIGLQARMLADAVGPGGHITGLDFSPELIERGKEFIEQVGMAERISFKQGDVRQLPFDDDTFDWVWSSDLVGYAPLKPLPLIKELARVVNPGGVVAILAWSSEMLLPGYPLLEARLRATTAGIAPFVKDKRPELHFLRALGWFHEAGLVNIEAHTFAGDAYAPLNDDLTRGLVALFDMRWPGVEAELSQEDSEKFQRLCLPDSHDFILETPDYYCFFTYTMFSGIVV